MFEELRPGVIAVGAYSGHGNVLGSAAGRAAMAIALGGAPPRLAQLLRPEHWTSADLGLAKGFRGTFRVGLVAKPVTNIDDPRYVKALSHPLRVRILALLQERTASPRELAEWLDATLGTVSYHVRALHDFGLIELVRTTQVRGAIAHHYRARVRPRVSDEAWASAAPIVKQAAVGAALQTVDDYARASAAAGGFDRGEAHLTRTASQLDAKGWEQAAQGLREAARRAGRDRGEGREADREGPARGGRRRRRARADAVRVGEAHAAGDDDGSDAAPPSGAARPDSQPRVEAELCRPPRCSAACHDPADGDGSSRCPATP